MFEGTVITVMAIATAMGATPYDNGVPTSTADGRIVD
jgi:hypothetical protein